MQGVQRYLVFTFLVLGVVLWATLSRVLNAIFYALDAPDAMILGSNFTATSLIGLLLAGGAVFYAFKSERVYNYSGEVVGELKKVTWPTKKETQAAVTVVIVANIVIAFILFIMDAVWGKLTGLIYN